MTTCKWALKSANELSYHDKEWGVPVHDDRKHFELLTLESAQSGLSWSTILAKYEGYLEAFANFNIDLVAQFNEQHVEELLQNDRIVRHRLKINATINNAKCIQKIQKEYGSFNHYIWSFVNYRPINKKYETESDVPSKTDLSDKIAKELKKQGFKFLGSTTIYAYMQAMGMVNDHTIHCPQHKKCAQLQQLVTDKKEC